MINLGCADRTARLLVAIRDATALQVVGRELNLDAITGKNPDVMHAHLAGDVGQYLVPVFEFDPKHRVRERLDHRPLEDDRVFFWLGQKYPPATMINEWPARFAQKAKEGRTTRPGTRNRRRRAGRLR